MDIIDRMLQDQGQAPQSPPVDDPILAEIVRRLVQHSTRSRFIYLVLMREAKRDRLCMLFSSKPACLSRVHGRLTMLPRARVVEDFGCISLAGSRREGRGVIRHKCNGRLDRLTIREGS